MGIEVSFEGVTGQGLLRCASAKSEVQHCTWLTARSTLQRPLAHGLTRG